MTMRWFIGLFITLFFAFSVTILLSYLPHLEEKSAESQVQRIPNILESRLYDLNVVDHLAKLPMELNIQRVDWNHAILSIDLSLPENETQAALIYKDLLTLSHFGLNTMSNVKQVLVRVFPNEVIDPNQVQLLLAMDAPRDQWSAEDYNDFKLNKLSTNEFLKTHFSLTFTDHWKTTYPHYN
jgi:hypothetical protein